MNERDTVIVLFGATGDLVSRKVIPSLFTLETEGRPVADSIVAFTRRDIATGDYIHDIVRPSLENAFGTVDEDTYARFVERFEYVRGDYDDIEDFKRLAHVLSEEGSHASKNILFYLPVRPEHLDVIVRYIKEAGVIANTEKSDAWKRIIVEKPFGKSLVSARELVETLETLFAPEEIYNIDHYLAKPMLRHIESKGRENMQVRSMAETRQVSHITVRLFETMGVEDRGAFYDMVGAFVDVGHNHVMQMLATVLVALSSADEDQAIEKKREQALESVKVLSPEDVSVNTRRAQYEGYRAIEGVRDDSSTETYFRVDTMIQSGEFKGVDVQLEGGKRIGETNVKEIEVGFAGQDTGEEGGQLVFRIEPGEEVELTLEPIPDQADEEAMTMTLPFREHEERHQYTEEYATLLKAAVAGNRALFLTNREVLLLWRFADPIVAGWRKDPIPLTMYPKHTHPVLFDTNNMSSQGARS